MSNIHIETLCSNTYSPIFIYDILPNIDSISIKTIRLLNKLLNVVISAKMLTCSRLDLYKMISHSWYKKGLVPQFSEILKFSLPVISYNVSVEDRFLQLDLVRKCSSKAMVVRNFNYCQFNLFSFNNYSNIQALFIRGNSIIKINKDILPHNIKILVINSHVNEILDFPKSLQCFIIESGSPIDNFPENIILSNASLVRYTDNNKRTPLYINELHKLKYKKRILSIIKKDQDIFTFRIEKYTKQIYDNGTHPPLYMFIKQNYENTDIMNKWFEYLSQIYSLIEDIVETVLGVKNTCFINGIFNNCLNKSYLF